MATKQSKNKNRYRTMRSVILTGSLLSILPLFILMKNAAGDTSTSTDLATSAQGIAATASPTQTTTSKSTAGQATTATQSTNTQASTSQTSSNSTTSAAMTYTRTKAS